MVVAEVRGRACTHAFRLRQINNEMDQHFNNRTLPDPERIMKAASTKAVTRQIASNAIRDTDQGAQVISLELRHTGNLQAALQPAGQFRQAVSEEDSPLSLGNIMSSKQVLAAVAVLTAALLGQRAMAEEPTSAPLSRETVKEDARAAQRAGRLTPAGEGSVSNKEASIGSTKTRAERKAETLKASKQGSLTPAGEGGNRAADRRAVSQPSTLTRAERKAATLRAAKRGELMPAGEGQSPVRK